jgi:hypothetical protein
VTTAVTIINPEEEVVWYHTDNRELDFYRARLSTDGESLLYNAASVSGDPADNSELVRVSLDGSVSSSIAIPLLVHDFVEHPDGTLAAIVVEYRDFDGTSLRGDKNVEVDDDGGVATVWSAWDCFDPAQEEGDNIEHGWAFANALDYGPMPQLASPANGLEGRPEKTPCHERDYWRLASQLRRTDIDNGLDEVFRRAQWLRRAEHGRQGRSRERRGLRAAPLL